MSGLVEVSIGALPKASDVNQLITGVTAQTDIGRIGGADPITDPVDAPSATVGSSGAIDNTEWYAYTYVTGDISDTGNLQASGETNLSPISSAVTFSNEQGSISDIAVGPTGTAARNLYRSPAILNPSAALSLSTNSATTSSLLATTYYVENDYTNTSGRTTVGSSQKTIVISNAGNDILLSVALPTGSTGTGIYLGTTSSPLLLGTISSTGSIVYSGSSTTGLSATVSGSTLNITISAAASGTGASPNENNTANLGTYKLVYTINDNTTTTYTDNIADSSLGANAPGDNTTGTVVHFPSFSDDPVGGTYNIGDAVVISTGSGNAAIYVWNGSDWIYSANITSPNGTITVGSSDIGGTTLDIDLGNANSWTAQQKFGAGIGITGVTSSKAIDLTGIGASSPYYDSYGDLIYQSTAPTNANWHISDKSSTAVLEVYVDGTAIVKTSNNTLDNGSGAMTAVGLITASSGITIPVGQTLAGAGSINLSGTYSSANGITLVGTTGVGLLLSKGSSGSNAQVVYQLSGSTQWEIGLLGSSAFSFYDASVTNTVISLAQGAPASSLTMASTGQFTFGYLLTASKGITIASGQTLTLTSATVAGAPTWSSSQTFPTGTTVSGTFNATDIVTSGTIEASGLITAEDGLTVSSGKTLTLTSATVAGAPTWSSSQTFPTGTTVSGTINVKDLYFSSSQSAPSTSAQPQLFYNSGSSTVDIVGASDGWRLIPYNGSSYASAVLTVGATGALGVSGLLTASAGVTVASGQTLTLTGASITGAPTWGSAQTFPGATIASSYTLTVNGSYGGTANNVTSLTAGSGINVTNPTGAGSATVTNAGVTSISAGTGIEVSASVGGITITNTNPSASSYATTTANGTVTLAVSSATGTAPVVLVQNPYSSASQTLSGPLTVSGLVTASAGVTVASGQNLTVNGSYAGTANLVTSLTSENGLTATNPSGPGAAYYSLDLNGSTLSLSSSGLSLNLAEANTWSAYQTFSNGISGLVISVSGLTGATASSRYVGATSSGAPTTGTFTKGDYVIDQTGVIWICTTTGSPGTWVSPTGQVATPSVAGVVEIAQSPTSGDPIVPTRMASNGEVEITATSLTTVSTLASPATGFYEIDIYFRVTVGSTVTTVAITYADATGNQTNTLLSSVTLTEGSYSMPTVPIYAVTGTAIDVNFTAGSANRIYASANIYAK